MAKKQKKSKNVLEFEEKLKNLTEFVKIWLKFHKIYRTSFKGEVITREGEADFLKMKSKLARSHVVLMEDLEEHYIDSESIRPILFQTVTLTQISKIRQEHYDKVEKDWHAAYIRLNESIGHLKFLLENEG